jgi:hypothetical protein
MQHTWITPAHEAILNTHMAAYQDAASESAQKAVLHVVKKAIRAEGKSGLPKRLAKVSKVYLCSIQQYQS